MPLRLSLAASVAILLFAAIPAGAQKAFKTMDAKEKNTTSKKYPPGSAWTLSFSLGAHIESTLDTTLYNFQRRFVNAIRTDAYATTGQWGGPALNMIYFQRPEEQRFFFENAIIEWVPTFAKQKFYNMYIPFTQLGYDMGFGSDVRTDNLSATFAGNVNRKIGIGAWVKYPYTKGAYAEQATKELGYGFSGYYAGDRYEMQAFFNHFNHLNKESGGITDDLYITDPAQLQGGVNSIEPKAIPTNLTDAHNRVSGGEFYMSHVYKLGYWRDITQPEDTVERKEFVASTRLVYSFDYTGSKRMFRNLPDGDEPDFWKNTYFDSSETLDRDSYWSLSNSFGIEMIEGFQKWAKFGLSAYVIYDHDKFRYRTQGLDKWDSADIGDDPGSGDNSGDNSGAGNLTPLPDSKLVTSKSRNRFWVGGRIAKTKGSHIRYSADAKFGVLGNVAGDIDVKGEIETRFRLGKDTVKISANGFFRNLEPNYIYNDYVGNHFAWHNNFGKVRSFRAEGRLYIPWSRTELRVGVENVQNMVYFNSESLPQQHGGSIQVFSAQLEQKLKFGIWNWNNTITYQATSNDRVLPLPELAVYSNMFLYFKAFKALTVQVGIDCNYYTKYKGMMYQPATMSFHVQGDNATEVGNYIFSNVYLTAKLYKVRFFLMCSHLNQGWFSKDYFSIPHYPLDPRQFRLGLSIDFTD